MEMVLKMLIATIKQETVSKSEGYINTIVLRLKEYVWFKLLPPLVVKLSLKCYQVVIMHLPLGEYGLTA